MTYLTARAISHDAEQMLNSLNRFDVSSENSAYRWFEYLNDEEQTKIVETVKGRIIREKGEADQYLKDHRQAIEELGLVKEDGTLE